MKSEKRLVIRLDHRIDADLITLYKGGIDLVGILAEALYNYMRGSDTKVIVEPCPQIGLSDMFKGKSVGKKGHLKIVPYRFEHRLRDGLSIKASDYLRSAFGNTFYKQLIRNSIVNISASPFFMVKEDIERKSARISDANESWDFEDAATAFTSKIETQDRKTFEQLLEEASDEMYICTRGKKIISVAEYFGRKVRTGTYGSVSVGSVSLPSDDAPTVPNKSNKAPASVKEISSIPPQLSPFGAPSGLTVESKDTVAVLSSDKESKPELSEETEEFPEINPELPEENTEDNENGSDFDDMDFLLGLANGSSAFCVSK